MSHQQAWKLKRGDRLQLGRRIGTVQRIINVDIADLLPEDCRPHAQKGSILEIELFIRPGVPISAFPGTLTNYWRIHRDPAELVNLAE